MNVWTFSGRVGADAELRTTQSGEKVLSFRVANDVGFGDRKFTQWVDCSLWGKRGESIAQYVKKGDKVAVSGELKLEEFQKRDGTPGSKLSVRVNDLDLGSGNREAGGQERNEYDQSPHDRSPRAPAPRQGGDRGGYERQGPGGRGGYGGGSTGGRPPTGKPTFDQSMNDEIPFLDVDGFDHQGCACVVPPRARRFAAEA